MRAFVLRLHGSLYLIPLFLLTTDAVLSLYEYRSGVSLRYRFTVFSFGITAGWLSFLTGVISLFFIRKNEVAAGLFFIHGFINSIALLVLSAFWSGEWKTFPQLQAVKLPVAILKWLMLLILVTGIYRGKKAAPKLNYHLQSRWIYG